MFMTNCVSTYVSVTPLDIQFNKETFGHLRLCLWRQKQVFYAKTWYFSYFDPNLCWMIHWQKLFWQLSWLQSADFSINVNVSMFQSFLSSLLTKHLLLFILVNCLYYKQESHNSADSHLKPGPDFLRPNQAYPILVLLNEFHSFQVSKVENEVCLKFNKRKEK